MDQAYRQQWLSAPVDEREVIYSPSSAIGGDYAPYIQQYVDQSAVARQACPSLQTLSYGGAATQSLDLYVPSAERKPSLLIFIHGGYWQELSKNESLFALPGAMSMGAAFAAVDYTLAPAASVAAIIDECRAATTFLHDQADHLGFDGNRIYVAGSSAGAHLAAMVALAVPQIAGAILVSGIYELAPLIGTSINDALMITESTAAAISPLRHAIPHFPPAILCWGEQETSVFKQQSRAFADKLRMAGATAETFEVPGRNHFDVILDLTDTTTLLGQKTGAMIR